MVLNTPASDAGIGRYWCGAYASVSEAMIGRYRWHVILIQITKQVSGLARARHLCKRGGDVAGLIRASVREENGREGGGASVNINWTSQFVLRCGKWYRWVSYFFVIPEKLRYTLFKLYIGQSVCIDTGQWRMQDLLNGSDILSITMFTIYFTFFRIHIDLALLCLEI